MPEPPEKDFPFELEAFLNTLARMLGYNGHTREVALLATATPRLSLADYDNWNGGQYTWDVILHVEQRTFSQFPAKEREAVEQLLLTEARPLFDAHENHCLGKFLISTEIRKDPEWREKALAWVTGQGVTNQGRVRSDNIATRECDGLLFRSQQEINLYKALKSLGVSFAPLPVFVRGGATYRRIEPDFVLIRSGIMLVVEVDGDTIHKESPAEAHLRTKMLIDEGAKLERLPASECETPERALASAKRLIALMEKFASQR